MGQLPTQKKTPSKIKALLGLNRYLKTFLIPLDAAADAAIHKKMFEPCTATLTILNEEINDIIKIVKLLEEPGLLIKGISETIKNDKKNKNKKEDFLECY